MNNSINYSSFVDLIVSEFSKEKNLQHPEQINREITLSIDNNEALITKTKFKDYANI